MTEPQDDQAAEPSQEIAVREELAEVRAELEAIRNTPPAVQRRIPNSLDEWVLVVRDYNLLAQSLAKTDFVPKDFKGKPDQITATMMYGREIGLPPMTTLQNTHVIHGRVGMYAEQLRAMILAAGHEYEIEESTSDRCVISGRRKGSERWQQHEYTMDRAKLSGLYAQNEQYRKRPTEMLLARASGIMAHAQFPDVIRGMGAIEELEGVEGDGEPDNAPVPPAAKTPATVGRKKAASKALTSQPAPSSSKSGSSEPEIPAEPGLPPLPGEAVPPSSVTDVPSGTVEPAAGAAESTPGEGPATATPTEPAAQCPHISNGVQCTWAPGHPGRRHSYDGAGAEEDATPALSVRHCPDFDTPHDGHTWRTDEEGSWVEYACQGVTAVQKAEGSAPVQTEASPPMSKADTIMLQARFKNLGFTDEPDDREARLHIASTILGRPEGNQIETFRSVHPGEGGMTKAECGRLLRTLAPCKGRDDVAELLLNMTRKADGDAGDA